MKAYGLHHAANGVTIVSKDGPKTAPNNNHLVPNVSARRPPKNWVET